MILCLVTSILLSVAFVPYFFLWLITFCDLIFNPGWKRIPTEQFQGTIRSSSSSRLASILISWLGLYTTKDYKFGLYTQVKCKPGFLSDLR